MRKINTAVLALIGAYTVWGIHAPMLKLGLETIPVPVFISLRFLGASLLMLPFAVRAWKPLKRKEHMLIVLNSVLAVTISSVILNIGLTKTTSINAAIIGLLGPLFLFAFSAKFLQEKLSFKVIIGILVALVGSLIIIGEPLAIGSDSDQLLGNLLILLSVIFSVVGTIVIKPLLKKTNTTQVTFMTLFYGSLPVALYAITKLNTWNVEDTSLRSWIAALYGTLGLVAANFLYYFALKRKKVQVVGVYSYLQSVVTVIAAWFLLSERPSFSFAIGALLVFLGIYLSESKLGPRLQLSRIRK